MIPRDTINDTISPLERIQKMIGTSWRTSLGGVVALCASIGLLGTALSAQFDSSSATVANWQLVLESFGFAGVALGLMNARDNRVTSEQAGTRR